MLFICSSNEDVPENRPPFKEKSSRSINCCLWKAKGYRCLRNIFLWINCSCYCKIDLEVTKSTRKVKTAEKTRIWSNLKIQKFNSWRTHVRWKKKRCTVTNFCTVRSSTVFCKEGPLMYCLNFLKILIAEKVRIFNTCTDLVSGWLSDCMK